MKSTMQSVTVALSIALLGASSAAAQPGMGRGPGGGGRMYDLKTVESLSGEVVSVQEVHGAKGGRGEGYGVHLMLKSDKEDIAVHLGPSWYLDKQGLKIAPGDRIEVRGSRITFEGKPAIIAAEVKKGSQTLKLRDDAGLPAWQGQGRHGR